jgi:hypothetical protein
MLTRILLMVALFPVTAFAQSVRLPQAASTQDSQASLEQVYSAFRAVRLSTLSASDQRALARQNVGATAYGNVAVAIQEGHQNSFLVQQDGLSNSALLIQRGQMNEASVWQAGNGNEIVAVYTGDANVQDITQTGSNNRYLLDFEGSNLHHSVLQIGDGNLAVQVGAGNQPANIEQRGNGMEVHVVRRRITP